jgi:hypothetical protein
MADHMKVTVYVPAPDVRSLRNEGKEPREFVREIVKAVLQRRRERLANDEQIGEVPAE